MIQETFIGNIQRALGHENGSNRRFSEIYPELSGCSFGNRFETNRRLKHQQQKANLPELLEQLMEAGKNHNIHVMPMDSLSQVGPAIMEIAAQEVPEWGSSKSIVAWDHPLINRLDLASLAELHDIAVYSTRCCSRNMPDAQVHQARQQIRTNIGQSFIGITTADFCLADTATLVLRTRPGHPRSVSLLPSIHVAIISMNQILPDLKTLYTLLRLDPMERKQGLTQCMSLITGPSKTGDIEMVLVYGAHGPKSVFIFVLTDPETQI